jgi:ABC-type transporter Mla MlaB component
VERRVLEISPLSDGTGLRIAGDLDLHTARELTAALRGFQTDGDVWLDMTEVTFIDSSGLTSILSFAHQEMRTGKLSSSTAAVIGPVFNLIAVDDHPSVEVRHLVSQVSALTGRRRAPEVGEPVFEQIAHRRPVRRRHTIEKLEAASRPRRGRSVRPVPLVGETRSRRRPRGRLSVRVAISLPTCGIATLGEPRSRMVPSGPAWTRTRDQPIMSRLL